MTANIRLASYLTDKKRLLKILLVVLGAFYIFASALPKHPDYWAITNMSMAFAVDPLHFMALVRVDYPPTFYALQGTWLKLGSYLLHYNLAISYDLANSTLYSYSRTNLGIFPFWGMIPILMALFVLVGVSYKVLKNKWLSLLCFGPITFVSVVLWGQIDVFCALFIFVSLILMQKALNAEKYLPLLLLAYLSLGISMQFKTYGGLLLPAYLTYTLALVKDKKLDLKKCCFTLLTCLGTFVVTTLIVWVPYPGWFTAIILHGESNWLFTRPSYLFQVPIWAIGYVLILCYIALRVLRNPNRALQDCRYFIFYAFSIVAWFFIAAYTHPQWWMFLLPTALLSLDNFTDKRGIIFCLLILAVFPVYIFTFQTAPALFALYHVTVIRITGNLSGFVSLALASLLFFWTYILRQELHAAEH
jgi:hypothetical protein